MANKIIFMLLISIAGCSTSPTSTVVLQPDSPVAVPTAQPLNLNPVQWQVLTLDQLKKLVAQMQANSQQSIIFGLDTENYNNLSLNFIEIQRYIEEQKAILAMLKNIIAERSGTPVAPSEAATKAPTP